MIVSCKRPIVLSLCRLNFKFSDFTLLYCRVQQNYEIKCLPQVQHDCFVFPPFIIIIIGPSSLLMGSIERQPWTSSWLYFWQFSLPLTKWNSSWRAHLAHSASRIALGGLFFWTPEHSPRGRNGWCYSQASVAYARSISTFFSWCFLLYDSDVSIPIVFVWNDLWPIMFFFCSVVVVVAIALPGVSQSTARNERKRTRHFFDRLYERNNFFVGLALYVV